MKKTPKKIIKEFETKLLGFKIKLLNVPIVEMDGEEVIDVDFEELAEQVFFDLLSRPIRLTGNQVRFMRKHLDLKQDDMKNLLGIKQGNFSRLEAKGDKVAFDNDIHLIALKAEFAKMKIQQTKSRRPPLLSDFIHPVSEYKNPDKTFVRKIA